jgi:hypothetical protein
VLKICFLIFVSTFWAHATAEISREIKLPFSWLVPSAIRKQTQQDFAVMATFAGDTASTLHQEIFGQLTGDAYVRFFLKRVNRIGYGDCGDPHIVACMNGQYENRMMLTPTYASSAIPLMGRLSVLMHESRHGEPENNNWPHMRCPSPFLDKNGNDVKSTWTGAPIASEFACDFESHGSYGISAIFLRNVEKNCKNCSEKLKLDAGLYAQENLTRVIRASENELIENDL